MKVVAPERIKYFEEVYALYGANPQIKNLNTKADYLSFKKWCKRTGKLPKTYPLKKVPPIDEPPLVSQQFLDDPPVITDDLPTIKGPTIKEAVKVVQELKKASPLTGPVPTSEALIDAVKKQALNQITEGTVDSPKWAKLALDIGKLEISAYKNTGKAENNFTPDDYLRLFNEKIMSHEEEAVKEWGLKAIN